MALNAADLRRIQFRCRRGMLELDMILLPFCERAAQLLSGQQWQDFERLLDEPDPDLYTWLMGYGHPEDPAYTDLVRLIRTPLA